MGGKWFQFLYLGLHKTGSVGTLSHTTCDCKNCFSCISICHSVHKPPLFSNFMKSVFGIVYKHMVWMTKTQTSWLTVLLWLIAIFYNLFTQKFQYAFHLEHNGKTHSGAAALSAPMILLCCSFASASFASRNPSSLSVDRLHSKIYRKLAGEMAEIDFCWGWPPWLSCECWRRQTEGALHQRGWLNDACARPRRQPSHELGWILGVFWVSSVSAALQGRGYLGGRRGSSGQWRGGWQTAAWSRGCLGGRQSSSGQ